MFNAGQGETDLALLSGSSSVLSKTCCSMYAPCSVFVSFHLLAITPGPVVRVTTMMMIMMVVMVMVMTMTLRAVSFVASLL